MFLLKKSPLIAPSILAITMFSSSAFATDDYSGQITATASTSATACTLDTSNSTSNLDFGDVAVGGQPADSVIAEKPFTIVLATCPVDADKTIKTSFSGVSMQSDGDITAETTAGSGAGNEVYFQILDKNGEKMTPDTASEPVTHHNDTTNNKITQTYYVKALRSSTNATGPEHVWVNYEVTDS